MFDNLSQKLSETFKKLSGNAKITEDNIKEGIREVRLALLEADVALPVAKKFIKDVKGKALGEDVIRNVNPTQMFISIIQDELTEIMGGEEDEVVTFAPEGPTVIMLAGLQGSGKTTTAAKLALHYRKRHSKNPMMVACDLQRPAAVEQLVTLGKQLDIRVFSPADGGKTPPEVAKKAVKTAEKENHDLVILDTAGRLHIDEDLMDELVDVVGETTPWQILLVCDAMTGQDAVRSADEFNQRLAVDGVILTKLDGDARGGVALSVKTVTQKPIKFVGIGEKLDALEEFHADRMASRILGMGDVVSLVEKAQAEIDEEESAQLAEKMKKATFNLNDFLNQMQKIERMGSLGSLVSMIPGMSKMINPDDIDPRETKRLKAIIQAMTQEERENPKIIDTSRRKRIATGSATTRNQVNQLIKQFDEMRKMMKNMARGGLFSKRGPDDDGGEPEIPMPSELGGRKSKMSRSKLKKRRKLERKRRKKGRR